MTEPVLCHIRSYSTEGCDPETRRKIQVFVASCETHSWRGTSRTKHGRQKKIDAHKELRKSK